MWRFLLKLKNFAKKKKEKHFSFIFDKERFEVEASGMAPDGQTRFGRIDTDAKYWEDENKSPDKTTKITRDPIFSRHFHPFGLEWHHFHWFWFLKIHGFALYYYYLLWEGYVERQINLFCFLWGYAGGLGITVGCHRYWTHKTFKANVPLQILMMILQTIALQFPIHHWSTNHRIHHKYTDTNSDPHNSKRGLFFSHVGWLLMPQHPDYKSKLELIDMSDLERDPIVRFQSKYFWTLAFILRFAFPIAVLCHFYGYPLLYAVTCNYFYTCQSLHFTFTVNSFAHKWGHKPYDKSISSVENATVSLLTMGEGWHNYHHTFPWDYQASEFGWKINVSTIFIDFFAWLGWAWDIKTVSKKMLRERLNRTGDGSHAEAGMTDYDLDYDNAKMNQNLDNPLWGWDDDRMPNAYREITDILHPYNT